MKLRKIIKRSYLSNKYNRRGEGVIEHHLERGHSIICKQSDGTPARKNCLECLYEARQAHQS